MSARSRCGWHGEDVHGDDDETSALASFIKHQERLKRFIEPDAVRIVREMTERNRKLLDPFGISRVFKDQKEGFGLFSTPIAARAMRDATVGQKMLSSGVFSWAEQKRIRDLVDPPGLRALRGTLAIARANHLTLAQPPAASLGTPLGIASSQTVLGIGGVLNALKSAHCEQRLWR